MRILVDTGVLLRLVNRAAPEHADIVSAVLALRRRGDDLVTTAQNIVEFWNVSTRPTLARGGFGRSVDETARCVEFFQRLGQVLHDDPAIFEQWKQLVISRAVSGKAVHDARIVAHMLVAKVDHILSFNPQDFLRYREVTSLTPADVPR